MMSIVNHVLQGYKQTEVGVIPEDWDVKRLGDVADPNQKWSFTGGPFGSNLKSSDYTNDGVRIIQLQNIGDGVFHNDSVVFTSLEKARELISCNIYPGEIILSKMGDPVARACIIPSYHERYLMCSDGIRLVVNPKAFNSYFVFVSINAPNFRTRAENAGTGSTRKRIGLTELRNLELVSPPLSEQRAIATALSDVDALLAAQDKLIAKKRDIKQAAMQQLLTGKQRLPGFTGEWVVKRLENIATVLKGNGLSKDKVSQSGSKKCVLYGELFTTYSRVITDVSSSTDSCEGTLSINGDVLLPGSTTTIGIDLATASALLCNDVLLGGDINIVRAKSNFYSSTFLAYLLTEEKKHKIAEMAQGITIIHLYGKSLLKLEICLPTIEEQTAIATILTDMDADLTALEQQRDKTRALKQGMMQELLTGRIRLV